MWTLWTFLWDGTITEKWDCRGQRANPVKGELANVAECSGAPADCSSPAAGLTLQGRVLGLQNKPFALNMFHSSEF